MRSRDWTLVFFTLLSQLSVGIVLCITSLVSLANDSRLLDLIGPQLNNPVLLALVVVGVAAVISLLHLGNPFNAPRSLNNLRGSWLSREILALAVYSVSLFVILILGWNNRGFEFLGYLLALSSAFGAAFLWMMTRIYVIPTIPPWNSWYTGLSFLSTTFGLGLMSILLFHHGLLVRAGCETCYEQFLNDGTTRMLVVSLGLVLLVELIGGFVHQSRLVKINTGIDRPVCDRGIFYRFFLARMAILVLLLVLVAMILFKSAVLTGDGSRGWVYLLPALVITQALIGRLLFFSSYSRVGV